MVPPDEKGKKKVGFTVKEKQKKYGKKDELVADFQGLESCTLHPVSCIQQLKPVGAQRKSR
jgi:hypothetical protein